MIKKILFSLPVFVLFGCGSISVVPEINLTTDITYKVFEIKDCIEEQSCYFQYPYGASVSSPSDGVYGAVEYDNCKVMYGTGFSIDPDEYFDVENDNKDNKTYQTITRKDGSPIYYVGALDGNNYKFWLMEENPTECKNFWKQVFDSFTDKPVFISDKYSFKVGILSGYKVDYLEDGQGITMVHRVAGSELEAEYQKELETWPPGAHGLPYNEPYNIEIGITAYENIQEYDGISDLLKKEYPGYTMEFSPNGVFVGEDQQMFSIRNFVILSENNKYIYRAYLRIPSQMYNFHKEEFDAWTKTIELF